jgi:hypothetical protein
LENTTITSGYTKLADDKSLSQLIVALTSLAKKQDFKYLQHGS